jgi:hypothetical protein
MVRWDSKALSVGMMLDGLAVATNEVLLEADKSKLYKTGDEELRAMDAGLYKYHRVTTCG